MVTFTTNGQFTWQQTNPLTGQVTTVQGTYTLGPFRAGTDIEAGLLEAHGDSAWGP